MKIGIDASRYCYGQATGVEWYSWHIINAILKEISEEGSAKDEVILYSREIIENNEFLKELKKINIKNKILPSKWLWTLCSLSKEIKKNPPDVLFVPSHTLPLSLPKRSIITIHDVAFKYLRKSYSFLQYHYLNWSTKYAVKNADKIIVPSEATQKDLITFFNCPKEKIEIIPHGFEAPQPIHEDVFENSPVFKYFKITKATKYILFVGRLESKKNLSRLVEAFSEFSKKYDEYKLILAGKRGIGFNEILKTVDRFEMMHKIIMPGYITEHEKSVLYKYCQFFVFPSLYEGFGLPILEAFYYEKPVLCSNTSSLSEVGSDCVVYIDPYDISSISKGLATLAECGDYIKELKRKGKERLKKFSWQDSAKKTLKLLYGQ